MDDPEETDRRQAIQLVLGRRPDIEFRKLGGILGELDLPVDEMTLIDDLDALGYEVEGDKVDPEPDRHREVSPAEDTVDPAAARLAEVLGATRPFRVAPERSGRGRTGPHRLVEDRGPHRRGRSRSVVVLGAAAVLVAAVLGAALLAGRDDEGSRATARRTTTTTAPATPSSAASTAASTAGPLDAAPIGSGGGVALLSASDGRSEFEVPSDGLAGQDVGSLPWTVEGGRWLVAAGRTALGPIGPGEPPGLALVDPGLDGYRAEVQLPTAVANNGLAFWARDAQSYWMFVALPALATFALVEVRDGESTVLGDTGLTITEEGSTTLAVRVQGARVEASVDGAVLIEHERGEDPPGRGIGIGSLPGHGGGTFDEFAFRAEP